MAKRWSGSSARARGARNRAALGALLITAALGAGRAVPARAQGAVPGAVPGMPPSGAPPAATVPTGKSAINPSFLLLPAFDVERMFDPNAPVKTLRVGDGVSLRVVGARGAFPGELKLDVPPGSESLDEQGWDIEIKPADPAGSPTEKDLRFEATIIKAGKVTLPALAIVDASGRTVGRTNPAEFEIQSAIRPDDPEPDKPVDARPPVGLPFPWWLLVLMTVAALAALGGTIYALWRWLSNRKPKAVQLPEIVRTEDEIALSALAELEKLALLRRGEFKKHYFRVSEILKAYLGARYRFDAPESTTREIVTVLEERKSVGDAVIDQVESIFERMDRVKFTDHVPESDEAERLVEQARQLVLSTRRPPQVVPSQPGQAGAHAAR